MLHTSFALFDVGLALVGFDGTEDDIHLFQAASLRLGDHSLQAVPMSDSADNGVRILTA